MFDKKHGLRPCAMAFAVALALGLSGCGGGGGGANVRPSSPPPPTDSGDFTGGDVNVGSGDTTVWPKDIGGSIDLIKGGAGTLVLTGTDSYTGGTTISAGTLQIGNGGTTGSITGNVVDNAFLVFDRSDDVSFNGIVSGVGSLEQAGKGVLTLTGANTYTGGTTIGAGTLRLGSGGTTGSIVGNVMDNGSLIFNRSDDLSFNGIVSGTGSLQQAGKGMLTLTGANAYTGGTTISAGTLRLGSAGTTGSIVGDVMDSGSLIFDRSDNVSFKGIVSGNGSLEQTGAGALILTGTNTYTGGTTISNGILQIGNGGTTGSIVGDVIDNGSLIFNRNDDVTFNGIISGAGSLQQAGKGVLTLAGANTYAGDTTISAGALQVGNGGTTGSIVGNVTDNGSLIFNRSDDVSFNGIISGSGSLKQNGKGVLTLTGANTYAGGTTINAGTLQLGNGGNSGSIVGNIIDNGLLVFKRSDQLVYTGSISGDGMLQQYSNGTLILDGDSNGFSGTSRASGGTLIVGSQTSAHAKLGGKVVVDGGAMLGGYGSVGDVTVTSYGVLAPGSSTHFGNAGTFGTFTVNGDLTLQQGSFIDLNLGAPGATSGTLGSGDNIKVNGDLALDGATLNVANVGGMGPGLYNIISYTGALSTSYGGLTTAPVPPQQQFTLQYVAGQVNLLVAPSPGIAFWAPSGPLPLGGDGIWTSTSETWTNIDGTAPLGPMKLQPGFAEFQGAPGAVTVDGSAGVVKVTGMQFFVDGYRLGGKTASDQVVLVNDSSGYAPVIEVGDGTTGSASTTATIGAVLAGTDGLIKTGYGSLVLTGNNTLAGQLQINGGKTELAGGGIPGVGNVTVNNYAAMGSKLQVDAGVALNAQVELEWNAALDNYGVITSDYSAVQSLGTAKINNLNGGNITTALGDAVVLGGGDTLTNDGSGSSILAIGDYGVIGYGVIAYNEASTVINTGGATITGSGGGVALGAGGKVINQGAGSSISANGYGDGVLLSGSSATVSNLDGASISGIQVGVDMGYGSQVENDGKGSLISAVGSEGSGWGVRSLAADGTVTNIHGAVISGAMGGIVLAKGGTVINGAGSSIESLSSEKHDCNDFENCAIYVDARYDGFGGALTLTNAGSIIGNVQMDPNAANKVTLTAGGSIDGNLDIGTSVASTLTLNGDAGTSQLYSQAVTGSTTFHGALIKDGDGTWTIDKDRLAFIAGTTINGGTLKAMSTLPGKVEVNTAGVLDGGPGVVGNLFNAGKIAVYGGDSNIGGNYTQSSTGTLAVSLGSKLDVTGTATLNGGTLEVTGADSGYVSNAHTNVLTAGGGVNGTFGRLVKDTGVVFTATTINYDANSVWLDTTGLNVTTAAAGKGVSYTPASMGSARRVQGAFEQLDDKIAAGKLSGVSSDFVHAAGQFQQAPTLQAAQASLQSLSGQLHAASAAMTFEAIDASSRALSDRFDNLLDKDTGFGTWTHDLNVGGDMARAGFDGVGFQLNGWLVGSDRRIGRSGVAGFAFGQSRGQQRLNQGFDHDNSRSTEGMLYAGSLNGNWYTQGRVGFGHFQQDVSRQILLGYSAQGVSTQYSGNYNVAYGESGLHFDLGGNRITPFVNAEYASIDRDGFAEQGAGGFGLRSNAQTLDRWQAGLGVRTNHHWALDGGRAVDFSARVQWQRTLASHGDVFDASFVGLQQWQPLAGIGLSRYSGLLGVGLDATLSARTALKFGYDYEMGQHDSAQMLSARLSVAF